MSQANLDTSSVASELRRKIDDSSALVGIVGLGYVGLPLALTFSEKGYRVLGFDVDRAKVEALSRGEQLHPAPRRRIGWRGRSDALLGDGRLRRVSESPTSW